MQIRCLWKNHAPLLKQLRTNKKITTALGVQAKKASNVSKAIQNKSTSSD